MKWDWTSRIALAVALTAFAYLISHQLHLRNETIRSNQAQQLENQAPQAPPISSGDAKTSGANSPANTGNGNTITYGSSTDKDKK